MVIQANGMLPFEVYRDLYDLAAQFPGDTIVEIGTAHGAGTISLCLGALSAGKQPKVFTVDRFEGRYSSRSAYGDVRDNLEIVRNNFRDSGIGEHIKIFAGSSSDFAVQQCPDVIDILVLDADGRIDRDLINFASKLSPHAAIVIDDYDHRVSLSSRPDGSTYVDLKHVITKRLLDRYVAEGLIDIVNVQKSTAFCRKAEGAEWDVDKMADMALECYRELVFTDIDRIALFRWLRKRVKANVPPWLMQRLRNYRARQVPAH
ncbi:O-methyltransferase [Microvirga sp. KLBC 81]|uniref:O-methyltransferase n=1 Tax=Microvirga sp. KLBC 81 TaxID=1862707 RepID=UPI0014031A7B|nr:class I SAM-dependent methyltransferase [Microvirga sp. KLBC 81]